MDKILILAYFKNEHAALKFKFCKHWTKWDGQTVFYSGEREREKMKKWFSKIIVCTLQGHLQKYVCNLLNIQRLIPNLPSTLTPTMNTFHFFISKHPNNAITPKKKRY